MAHPDAVADEATALGLGLFDCGVDPRDFANRTWSEPVALLAVITGIGLHPWWLADGRCGPAEVNLLCKIAAQEHYIGEVGLDFSARFDGSEPLQIQAFDRLCDTLVQRPLAGRVISIHAVRSAGTVLDVLESHGLLIPNPDSPVIIFHWFSGTSDELVRARNAGCYFSVNERMLAIQARSRICPTDSTRPSTARDRCASRTKHRNKRAVAHQITHKNLRTHRLAQKLRRKAHRVGSFSKCALCF